MRVGRYLIHIGITYPENTNEEGNRQLWRIWRLMRELVASDLTIDGDFREILKC